MKNKKNVDKLIREADLLIGRLETDKRRLKRLSSFATTKYLGRGVVGNFARSEKSKRINWTIDKLQEDLLTFNADLLAYDPDLGGELFIPHKLTEYSRISGPISDFSLRFSMRQKALDASKCQASLKKIRRRLVHDKRLRLEKEAYEKKVKESLA